MLRMEVVRTRERMGMLKKAWDRLVQECPALIPFATYDWMECCLTKEQRPLFVICLWKDDELVGVAPWWLRIHRRRGFRVRQLEFISSADTPWADIVMREKDRSPVLEQVFHGLCTDFAVEWDVLSLQHWPEYSPNRSWVEHWLRVHRYRSFGTIFARIPCVPIQESWEAFASTKPQRTRKTQRNIENRVAKLPNVSVECHRGGEVEPLMTEVLAIAKKGWKFQEGKSLANEPRTIDFFSRLTERAVANGWLFLWVLRVDGVPVAMEYDLTDGRRVFALRSDFDETYRDCSPGRYLETHILKWLFEHQWEEYQYGPGVNPYKLFWATAIRQTVKLDIFNQTWRGRGLGLLECRVIPFAKTLRDRWLMRGAESHAST